jgi:hypothetical protein
MMNSNIVVGSLMIVAGIYAAAVQYFRPQAFVPKMSPTPLRVLCAIAIICGFFVAFSRLLFHTGP